LGAVEILQGEGYIGSSVDDAFKFLVEGLKMSRENY
jgi:hypothetical protein